MAKTSSERPISVNTDLMRHEANQVRAQLPTIHKAVESSTATTKAITEIGTFETAINDSAKGFLAAVQTNLANAVTELHSMSKSLDHSARIVTETANKLDATDAAARTAALNLFPS